MAPWNTKLAPPSCWISLILWNSFVSMILMHSGWTSIIPMENKNSFNSPLSTTAPADQIIIKYHEWDPRKFSFPLSFSIQNHNHHTDRRKKKGTYQRRREFKFFVVIGLECLGQILKVRRRHSAQVSAALFASIPRKGTRKVGFKKNREILKSYFNASTIKSPK